MLWLWHRLAAVALIQSLAWEPPYAVGVALKRQTNKQTKKESQNIELKEPKGHDALPGMVTYSLDKPVKLFVKELSVKWKCGPF